MTVPQPGLIEGQTVEADLELDADVVIVGTGPGGAVTAQTLASRGLKVLMLEEGGYYTNTRFRMHEDEAYPALYQDGAARTTKDLSMVILQGKAVGGTSVINWTTCFRTPERTLDHWRTRWGTTSITREELDPYFEKAEARLGVSKVPPEQMNRNNRLLYDGCKQLGFEVDTIKRNVKGCAQTGFCGLGCPIDAKQSMLVSYVPDAMNHGATIVSRCHVDRLLFEGDKVTGVEGSLLVADGTRPTGKKLKAKGKYFVLSGGAINTPAMLLRSGAPDPNAMIGKRTFLHPVVVSAGMYDEPVNAFYGAPQSAASHHFEERDGDIGFFLEAAPIQPGLGATVMPGMGAEHRKHFKKLPLIAGHIALTIDGFHEDVPGGTVALSDAGRPILDYVLQPRQWRTFREAHKVLARIQFASGAKLVSTCHEHGGMLRSPDEVSQIDDLDYAPGTVLVTTAHVMGGSLMSDDPKVGVVRAEDLRHKSVTNLHIIDGSVFPTSLGVNPQMSIYGLAGFMSERLADRWTQA